MHFEAIQPLYIDEAAALYENAFPEEERRPTADWIRLMSERASFHADAILLSDGTFAGILTYWTFKGFGYVEHFATQPALRGHGLGGKAIASLIEKARPTPIVLEVEPPTDETARRRISFYERQGLSLVEKDYIQPPYRPDGECLNLHLMSTDKDFAETNFTFIKGTIHREVYGVAAEQ